MSTDTEAKAARELDEARAMLVPETAAAWEQRQRAAGMKDAIWCGTTRCKGDTPAMMIGLLDEDDAIRYFRLAADSAQQLAESVETVIRHHRLSHTPPADDPFAKRATCCSPSPPAHTQELADAWMARMRGVGMKRVLSINCVGRTVRGPTEPPSVTLWLGCEDGTKHRFVMDAAKGAQLAWLMLDLLARYYPCMVHSERSSGMPRLPVSVPLDGCGPCPLASCAVATLTAIADAEGEGWEENLAGISRDARERQDRLDDDTLQAYATAIGGEHPPLRGPTADASASARDQRGAHDQGPCSAENLPPLPPTPAARPSPPETAGHFPASEQRSSATEVCTPETPAHEGERAPAQRSVAATSDGPFGS